MPARGSALESLVKTIPVAIAAPGSFTGSPTEALAATDALIRYATAFFAAAKAASEVMPKAANDA